MKVAVIKEGHRQELLQLVAARRECDKAQAQLATRSAEINAASVKLREAMAREYWPDFNAEAKGYVVVSDDCLYLTAQW